MLPIVVMMTYPAGKDPQTFANMLVKEKLGACVNIIPGVTSVYWWQGQIEQSSEVIMLVKTHQIKWEALQEWVINHHPYDVPELIQWPIQGGLPAYLQWIETSVGDKYDGCVQLNE